MRIELNDGQFHIVYLALINYRVSIERQIAAELEGTSDLVLDAFDAAKAELASVNDLIAAMEAQRAAQRAQ